MPERTVLEFFAGIGLVRLALEPCGWRVLLANDVDNKKYEMYSQNFRDAATHYRVCDIRDLKAEELPRATLAQASFPCIDLSLAGYRRGINGEHSGTYWNFVRVLDELGDRRPPLVLIENVVGFLSSHGGGDFRLALEALSGLGYCYDAFVLDAVRFVPQSRPRLFIIGTLHRPARSVTLWELLSSPDESLRPPKLAAFMRAHFDLNWSLLPLPPPPPAVVGFQSLLEDVPEDDSIWWSNERAEYLLGQMSCRHRRVAESMICGNKASFGTVYRRIRYGRSMAELRTDGIAGCLRTPRGGSSRQILFVAGHGRYRVRYMTPREYARLQGVPDWYKTEVPATQALFGFGDAVCVPAVRWIAENVLNPLAEELRRPQPISSSPEGAVSYAGQPG